jgi:MoxR-like ATPase
VARAPGQKAVYEIIELFKTRCLSDNKSLLWPDRAAWTTANTSALWVAFMEHPDASKRSFREKWQEQLQNESEDVHRVAAELIVLYNLFPMNIGKEAKLNDLKTVISWKLSNDSPDISLVERAFERGLGNPGTHYLTAKPWHIAFYLEFSRRIIKEKIDIRNLEACKQLANAVQKEVPQSVSARNIALHLMFPDSFERIASEAMRQRIVEVFREYAGGADDQDDALLNIRNALKQSYGRENLEFYDKDIAPLWREKGNEPVNFWIEKTIVRGRPDREQGKFAVGKALWSPKRDKRGGDIYRFMRDAKSGDVVFHLTDNEAVNSISRVDGEFQEFNGVAGTEWGEGPSYLVPLRDNVHLVPSLSRTDFFSEAFSMRLLSLINGGAKNLFFNRELTFNQGAYLTPAPPALVQILDDAYKRSYNKSLSELAPEIAELGTIEEPSQTSWIFQANPNFYDVRGALRRLTKQTWLVSRFRDDMALGDKVYLWESGSEGGIVGVAEIEGLPMMASDPDEERPFVKEAGKFEGEHLRATLKILRVVEPPITRNELMSHAELRGLSLFRAPQGTNFRLSSEQTAAIEAILGKGKKAITRSAPTLLELADATNLSVDALIELEALLRAKRQLVLEGPPGSGKTYVAQLLARYTSENPFDRAEQENLLTIQFHQSYGYEDFVQGIRPTVDIKGQLTYRVEPGLFKLFCEKARNSDRPFVLVIDEINRGNISRIFGELLYLLEYRDETVSLPYDKSRFSIPSNVFIIATMNTTDRSLAQIDYALRRRFYFYRLLPVSNHSAPVLERALQKLKVEDKDRDKILRLFVNLNERVQEKLGEQFQIGHSHFILPDIGTDEVINRVWNRAVVPLLEEYFYNSRDRASVLAEFSFERLLG